MDNDEFEAQMRALEYFHTLRAIPGVWIVLRVDGRSFTRFTASRFEKPFDSTLHGYMVETARALLTELQGLYVYTESDEISVLLAPTWDLFDREVEKLVSISASVASATFTHLCQAVAQFDSRIWLGISEQSVVDYFRWRQEDAARGSLHAASYWALRRDGLTEQDATAALHRRSVGEKNELLFQHGINYNNLPTWQRRGAGLYWETYEKAGYNPKRQEPTVAQRRRVVLDEELPMKDAYADLIRGILATTHEEDEA
ncbi:MAG TPA: tRNA(His) guanylyltransferase Thg1 family protein [Ktedonobacterales bacterium]|nr:tRNA(His) guanylyltransferase Thg1 family protein [Ktedonobacterales bacterium]